MKNYISDIISFIDSQVIPNSEKVSTTAAAAAPAVTDDRLSCDSMHGCDDSSYYYSSLIQHFLQHELLIVQERQYSRPVDKHYEIVPISDDLNSTQYHSHTGMYNHHT